MSLPDPDACGVATATDTVRFERLLPGPVERIWAYLTESDKRRQWLAGCEMELKVGGRADLLFKHSEFTDEPAPEKYAEMNAKGHPSQHHITEIDPPRLLAMTWPGEDDRESEVVFELFPEGEKVLLVVTHKRLADRGEMANVASGWHAHLGILATALEGGKIKRFWSRIPELEAEYQRRFSQD
ncbi:SRPBCC family protein [Chelativorans xinjiangense]|uniref:SRPBCC family protein n=1 Tax=Chelativorans xinjiangense TaxID=2681485 RepID=UPI00135A3ED3|nr:SRPBCC family protein [Chelativorans xinjiangense]